MSNTCTGVDARSPKETAIRVSGSGVAKTRTAPASVFVLALLAGMFIAFGAIFATTVAAAGGALPYGVSKILGGIVFCLGLILVIGAGAELFTGNTLIVVSWMDGETSLRALLNNWLIVYVGNFAGSVLTAGLMLLARQYTFADGAVGATALSIADHKVHLAFLQAIALGILCNTLVCLAIWMCAAARSMTDRILAILFPITAFVAAGFEHSVANMYFIPMGLFLKKNVTFLARLGKTTTDYADLTWANFLILNLLPVTLGNIIGGAGVVGMLYWFAYLKPTARE